LRIIAAINPRIMRKAKEYRIPLFHDFLNNLLHIKPVNTAGRVRLPSKKATS
jgi:hypothetical protein